jgi:hypothetical protein
VVEHLLISKYEVLSSNPSTTKKNNNDNKKIKRKEEKYPGSLTPISLSCALFHKIEMLV